MTKAVHDDFPHVVHRLESFSDIVIGFALAQTALSLVIPAKPVEFYTNPIGIVAYLATFMLIARFWWDHAEIFRHYFAPTRIAIFLNFAALAALGLFVFSLQMWLHPHQSDDAQRVMARAYVVNSAVTYGLLAVLRLVGVRARWEHLEPERRKRGVSLSVRLLCVVLGALVGAFLLPSSVLDQGSFYLGTRIAAFPLSLVIGIAAGAVLARIAAHVLGKRDWGSPANTAQRL